MTEPASSSEERARRRRIAEVFGDVLPETTSDESADADSDGSSGGSSGGSERGERWYRENRPPHHGSD